MLEAQPGRRSKGRRCCSAYYWSRAGLRLPWVHHIAKCTPLWLRPSAQQRASPTSSAQCPTHGHHGQRNGSSSCTKATTQTGSETRQLASLTLSTTKIHQDHYDTPQSLESTQTTHTEPILALSSHGTVCSLSSRIRIPVGSSQLPAAQDPLESALIDASTVYWKRLQVVISCYVNR